MMDINHARMLRARADHDDAQRQAQLTRISGQSKPSPDANTTVADAEMLIQAHDYADGEVIGLVPVGGHGDSRQRVIYHDGRAVVDPSYDRVLNSRGPGISDSPAGWTAQSSR